MGVDPESGNGRQAAGTADDPIHVERNTSDVPLALLIRLVGLSFLGYVVISLSIGAYLWYRQDNARFEDQRAFARQLSEQNEGLTRRLNAARIEQGHKIQTAVANLCASAELRDTVITNQSRAIVALLRQVPEPPPPAVTALIEASQDGIRTLEPKDEKDCPLAPETP